MPIDATHARTAYSNFCRVTGTPEELIIEFGLNSQPQPVPSEPIQIAERVVLNYYTAKRLLGALHMSVQRHEAAFGTLEIDVQKRVKPTAPRLVLTPTSSANATRSSLAHSAATRLTHRLNGRLVWR